MAKWIKRILGLAAISGAVAGVIYYFKKFGSEKEDDFSEEFEDEDFDLDSDLKPASDREYVSLTPKTEEADSSESARTDDTNDIEDTEKPET